MTLKQKPSITKSYKMPPPTVTISVSPRKKGTTPGNEIQRSHSNVNVTVQKHCMQMCLDSEERGAPVAASVGSRRSPRREEVPRFGPPRCRSTRALWLFTSTSFTLLSELLANTRQHLRLLHKTTTLRRQKGRESLSRLLEVFPSSNTQPFIRLLIHYRSILNSLF